MIVMFGCCLSESTPPEPPSTLLWATVLAAQHFDAVGNYVKALEYIDEALHHTPTDVQIYMTKAKIFKVQQECGHEFIFFLKKTGGKCTIV